MNVGAALVAARIARRAMTAIALARDSGSHKGCPYTQLWFGISSQCAHVLNMLIRSSADKDCLLNTRIKLMRRVYSYSIANSNAEGLFGLRG